MDAQKIAVAVKNAIMGELRDEFKEFRAEVRGQLDGFKLAIDTMNKRLDGIESRVGNIERSKSFEFADR
ncbi:hypothetical protein DRP07_05625 [Archaeoglobales archaeon]|nr:MAG: hypothetical protein DRP07_05625 [Archaeoglobales archaeon]